MTSTKKTMRQAKALLKMFAASRKPQKVSPYVRMAKALVG